MLEAQVVSMFSVQKLSFTEKGMPSSGPRGLPFKKIHGAHENYYPAVQDLNTLCDSLTHTHTPVQSLLSALCACSIAVSSVMVINAFR